LGSGIWKIRQQEGGKKEEGKKGEERKSKKRVEGEESRYQERD